MGNFEVLNESNSFYPGFQVVCENVSGLCFFVAHEGVCQMLNKNGKPVTKDEYLAAISEQEKEVACQKKKEELLNIRKAAFDTNNCFDRRRRKYYAVSSDWDIYDTAVKEISAKYYTKISGAKGKLKKNYSLVVSCPKEHFEDLEELFDEIIWTPSDYYKDGPFSSENGENERFRTNRKALRYIEI